MFNMSFLVRYTFICPALALCRYVPTSIILWVIEILRYAQKRLGRGGRAVAQLTWTALIFFSLICSNSDDILRKTHLLSQHTKLNHILFIFTLFLLFSLTSHFTFCKLIY